MKTAWRVLVVLVLALAAPSAFAQPTHVQWKAAIQPGTVTAGGKAEVLITATIEKPWHMYSLTQPDGGPIKTSITLLPGSVVTAGTPKQPAPKKEKDATLGLVTETFEGSVTFKVPVTISKTATGAQTVKFKVRYQVCNASLCMPPTKEEIVVKFTVGKGATKKAETPRPVRRVVGGVQDRPASSLTDSDTPTLILAQDKQVVATDETTQKIEDAKKRGILPFILLSMSFGFIALITPCVFPMIPITVSYFTKSKAGTKGGGVGGAFAYTFGIISAFTFLGLAVTLIFGPTALSKFGTNPYINLAFAVLFIVLGANLLGMFELTFASGLTNKIQSDAAKRGGYLQPFLMGLAFTLTSFTCTAPYVGTVLATAAQQGIFYPLVGMLAFSTAFALPFLALAIFPQRLASLPKSGSWLATVKAYMGLLEFAAALKFLSNADLVWQKGLLTRPVFLAILATLFVIAGMYLLGWVRFPKDDVAQKIGVARRVVGAATVFTAFYCLAAMQGAGLGFFEAFPPPDPYPGRAGTVVSNPSTTNAIQEVVWKTNYEEAMKQAKAENKPLFVNFTGVTCVNCRLMEKNVLPLPDVKSELNQFITVELFTDRDQPEDEKNQALQKQMVNTVALPVYVTLTPDGKVTKVFQGLAQKPQDFVQFLKDGRAQAVALR